MAFLFGSARYSAFVAKQVLDIDAHEGFVTKMAGEYADMLRQHLADESLDGSAHDIPCLIIPPGRVSSSYLLGQQPGDVFMTGHLRRFDGCPSIFCLD